MTNQVSKVQMTLSVCFNGHFSRWPG